MGTEIERKFLVTSDAWREAASRRQRMRQAYLANSRSASVRVRVAGGKAWLNIKGATIAAVRDEFEYEIPLADGEALLSRLAATESIDKTRYWVRHEGYEWEVDEFHGENQGLIVAEIELADAAEQFPRPDWLGLEVTELARYYNVSLVDRPYRDWTSAERAP